MDIEEYSVLNVLIAFKRKEMFVLIAKSLGNISNIY